MSKIKMHKYDYPGTMKIKRCSGLNHVNGGWYEGKNHFLGFEGEPGVLISHLTLIKLFTLYMKQKVRDLF